MRQRPWWRRRPLAAVSAPGRTPAASPRSGPSRDPWKQPACGQAPSRKAPRHMLSPIVDRVRALEPVQLALVLLAAFALVGTGTAVASNLITGSDIKDHTVQSRDIANAT